MQSHKVRLMLLLGILVLAGFLRFYNLKSVPAGLDTDEAINGNNALEALETGHFKIFYPENNGREGLFINVQALALSLFGNEPWVLRVVSALFGLLTVLGIYLLTLELFSAFSSEILHNDPNDERFGLKKTFDLLQNGFGASRSHAVALLASFFAATSVWHIIFSRIGLRAIAAPFFLTFGFYFLIKAYRKLDVLRSQGFAFLSGLILGLGFYTYTAYRILPLLLGVYMLLQWRHAPPHYVQGFKRVTAICILIALTVSLPLALYFLNHPKDFFAHVSDLSVLHQSTPMIILHPILLLGIFNFGSRTWPGTYPTYADQPLLWWPVGILFMLGLVAAIVGLVLRRSRPLPYSFPLIWLVIMLIPSMFSFYGIPALRVLIAFPAACILAAMGGVWLGEFVVELFSPLPRLRNFFFILLAATFFFVHVAAAWDGYFFNWARQPILAGWFGGDYMKDIQIIKALPNTIPKYAIIIDENEDSVRNWPKSFQSFIFAMGGWNPKKWQERGLEIIHKDDLRKLDLPAGALLILLEKNAVGEAFIKARIPNSTSLALKDLTVYRTLRDSSGVRHTSSF